MKLFKVLVFYFICGKIRAHTKMYVHLQPQRKMTMFWSMISPSANVRLRNRVRNFDEKVQETFLSIGELSDALIEIDSKRCNASSDLHLSVQQFKKIRDSHNERHLRFDASQCDCISFEAAQADYRVDVQTCYAIWKNLVSQEIQIKQEIMKLYQGIADELGRLLDVREDAGTVISQVFDTDSIEALDEVIGVGDILSVLNTAEAVPSLSLTGVR